MFIGAENTIFRIKEQKKNLSFLMKCISEILIRKIIIERKKPINSEKNESKIDYIPIQIAIANLFYTLILFSTQTLGDSGFF
jgi:hypothetical protein